MYMLSTDACARVNVGKRYVLKMLDFYCTCLNNIPEIRSDSIDTNESLTGESESVTFTQGNG
jgi:hypothetical protein